MQALIITAYKEIEQLEGNLEIFSKHFKCYVHIDKSSLIATEEVLERLNAIDNVKVISKYEIKWGSYLHMMAIIDLLRLAVKDSDNTYYHIISGEDFPIKSVKEFDRFFNKENHHNYMEVTDITQMPVMQKRYKIYHFMHIFDRRSKNILVRYIDKIIRNVQYIMHVSRRRKFSYKGLVWCSLTREAVEYVLKYVEDTNIIHTLKYCEIAEEFIFQNLLIDSEQFHDTVVRDNLRFAVWDEEHVNGPRVLTLEDMNYIDASDYFFARKVEYDKDNPVYKLLVNRFSA